MSFHNLNFRAFVHATEDEERVVKALIFVSGASDVSRMKSSGYHGNPITILEVAVKRKKDIDAFFDKLGKTNIAELLRTLDRRIDDECSFFLRLDKQEAYLERIVLSGKDDVIAVRGKIKAYSSKKSIAFEVVAQYLILYLE
ncbi:MAG: RNA-binding domain-containing protein [Methanomassiliicoccales archaeon]